MKRNVVLRVAGYQFKKLGVSTLCFLGIYGLGLTALEIVLAALGEPEVLAVTDHLPMVARIFVIVMGIVSPLVYAGPYLAVGVTRRQFAAGFMLAGVGLLLGFSLLFLAIALWNGVFSAGGAALWLTTSLLGFFAGWSGAMGFQIRPHIVPAGLGLLGAWILAVGGELLVTALGFSEPAQIGSTLAMAAVAAFLLWRASGRITVRC